jgi:hypothetical protein
MAFLFFSPDNDKTGARLVCIREHFKCYNKLMDLQKCFSSEID